MASATNTPCLGAPRVEPFLGGSLSSSRAASPPKHTGAASRPRCCRRCCPQLGCANTGRAHRCSAAQRPGQRSARREACGSVVLPICCPFAYGTRCCGAARRRGSCKVLRSKSPKRARERVRLRLTRVGAGPPWEMRARLVVCMCSLLFASSREGFRARCCGWLFGSACY
jgi:hypothetical protein